MTYSIDVLVGPDHLARELRSDIAEGLISKPKQLRPKWFYDERGSRLFDEITRLPEYYLTRRETEILNAYSGEIVDLADADTLVELGSGTSEKTRLLLDVSAKTGRLRRFVSLDVSDSILREASEDLLRSYPGIAVHAVVGDFELHLDRLPREGRRLVIFLGSTIGNLEPIPRKQFLNQIADGLDDGDHFLVGIDLVKDVDRLEAAYNDSARVTEAFNKNVLHVINRELHANFDPDRFEHRAIFERESGWIEMHLIARAPHVVEIHDLDMEVYFDAAETLRTEISTKFVMGEFVDELASAGMKALRTWTDSRADFALILATR